MYRADGHIIKIKSVNAVTCKFAPPVKIGCII
jgi:hypothetical protein